MSFIPLVMWILGWLYIVQYEKDVLLAHKQVEDYKTFRSMMGTYSVIWLVGIAFFFCVGFWPPQLEIILITPPVP